MEEEVAGGGGVGGDAKTEAKAERELEKDPDGPGQKCHEPEHLRRYGTSEGDKGKGGSFW